MKLKEGTALRGFTLIEVVLAMGIIATLFGSVMVISKAALNHSHSLANEHQNQQLIATFENHLKRSLTQSTKSSQFMMDYDQSGSLQTITIIQPNLHFPHQGNDVLASEMKLVCRTNRSGFIRLSQQFFSGTKSNRSKSTRPTFELALLDNLRQADWEFYNQSTKEWLPTWQNNMGNPSQIRFTYKRDNDPVSTEFLVWVPRN